MLQIKTTRITILISNYEGQKTKSMITFFLRRTKSQSCCNSMYIELIDKEHQSPQNNPHQKKKKANQNIPTFQTSFPFPK